MRSVRTALLRPFAGEPIFETLERALAIVLVWKVGTKVLYLLKGRPSGSFVERFGSYAAPLALSTMLRNRACCRLPRLHPGHES